jgi:riboflavin kinase/FMN adenylyltransferase
LGLDEVRAEPCAVAIGVFDGVHRGHRALIRTAQNVAARSDLRSVVLTFDPNPAELVRPQPPARLSTMQQRLELFASLGVDATLVLPFDVDMSHKSPLHFYEEVLRDGLGARALVVGENFRFGYRASGDVPMLTEFGAADGVEVLEQPLVRELLVGSDDVPISSTEIRGLVDAGEVAAATRALARPHRVEGTVVRGAGRGRDLGYPTANVHLTELAAVPGDGVYAARVVIDPYTEQRRTVPAAVSVGDNPTFDGQERTVEAFVLDAADDLDLYDRFIAVDFVARLRGQQRFASVPALIARMDADVADTRALLGLV